MRRRGGSKQAVKGQRASRARKVSIAAPSFADLQDQVGTLARELKEALERQTAMAEVLQVINASPGNPVPMLETLLDHATRLCGAQYGILWLGNRDGMVAAALRNVPTAYANYLKQAAHRFSLDTAVGQALATRRPVQVDDVRAGVNTDPMRRATADLGGARTLLTVPMLRKDQIVGVLAIFRQEVRPFDEAQIRLVTTFADQAVIAIENARLLTEQREALEQQTATAEVLQVINSSPGNLRPVFDAMLERAMRLCEASFGSLWTLNGDHFHPVAHRGLPAPYAEYLRRDVPAAGAGTGRARLLAGEAFAHIADLANDQPYRTGEPHRRALVDLGGARTALLVPLGRDDTVSGFIMIYRQEVRPFTDKQIALLQTFAAQAVIAMENARLINETREALDQQTATAEVLTVINSSPGDLVPVFETILGKAHALCGAAHGTLQLYDGERFYAVAVHGLSKPVATRLREGYVPGPNDPAQRLFAGEDYVHVRDMAEIDDPMARVVVGQVGIRTFLSVALRKESKLLGRIVASRRDVRPFADKEISLLRSFAAQAVIAMENARLLGELRERTDQVAELNRGLEARVAEQVEELGRVGRLKRFLAPQLAELIVSQGDEKILESHRREIVVVFCDLRGYTAFAEAAEPEEVLDFLREYHGALGPLVSQFEGTLDQFSGDGIMVFFNDPVPIPDPAARAVKMAIAMREAASSLTAAWRERGRELGFGAGIAQGYATLGQIGFSERSGYTAIGTVCNVAARLCGEAKDGQVLLSQRVNVALKGSVATEQVGPLVLKGLSQPVVAYNVPLAVSQPALRVIDGGHH
jgi:class 3 adenylate cyclase